MVDFGHSYMSRDDCNAEKCPVCEFKHMLSDAVCQSSVSSEGMWHEEFGAISDRLFDAVWALNRVRRELFTDDHDEIANGWNAANSLVGVYVALDQLRHKFGLPPFSETYAGEDEESDQ